MKRKTNVIGTVRPIRNDMPPDITAIELKTGESATWSSKNLLAVKWRDNRNVHYLTSKTVPSNPQENLEEKGVRHQEEIKKNLMFH
jgi:hypothetical protein